MKLRFTKEWEGREKGEIVDWPADSSWTKMVLGMKVATRVKEDAPAKAAKPSKPKETAK